jgi:hypothetical protein
MTDSGDFQVTTCPEFHAWQEARTIVRVAARLSFFGQLPLPNRNACINRMHPANYVL